MANLSLFLASLLNAARNALYRDSGRSTFRKSNHSSGRPALDFLRCCFRDRRLCDPPPKARPLFFDSPPTTRTGNSGYHTFPAGTVSRKVSRFPSCPVRSLRPRFHRATFSAYWHSRWQDVEQNLKAAGGKGLPQPTHCSSRRRSFRHTPRLLYEVAQDWLQNFPRRLS